MFGIQEAIMEETDTINSGTSKYEELIKQFLQDKWPPKNYHLPVGIEGRIFEAIVQRILDRNHIDYVGEKRHPSRKINEAFRYAASKTGRNLRTRTHYYIPDFTLANFTWLEVTLWESEAHKKTFLYSHQCNKLIVLYLCSSNKIYFKSSFHNTQISSVFEYFPTNTMGQNVFSLNRLKTLIERTRCRSK